MPDHTVAIIGRVPEHADAREELGVDALASPALELREQGLAELWIEGAQKAAKRA